MKKFSLFLSILAFLFFSCAENLENHDSQQKSGNVIIKVENANSSSRFISPVDSIDISKVEEWNIEFTPVNPVKAEKTKAILKPGENSVKLGVGTYNFYIEGSYILDSDTENKIILVGSKKNITVVEDKTAELSVLVALKKTDGGEGDVDFSFEFDDNADKGANWTTYYAGYGTKNDDGTIKYSTGIKVILFSRKDKTEYSTENGYLKFVDSVDNSDSDMKYLKFSSNKKIPSGYYYLELSADYSKKSAGTGSAVSDVNVSDWRKISFNSDNLIEIADNKTTSCNFANLVFPNTITTYTYYASDKGSEDSNGLRASEPGTLNKIIENIYANKSLTEATINYTYSDKMEFDVSKIQNGKEITVEGKKTDSENSPIGFIINSDGLTDFISLDDKNGLILTASDETKKAFSIASLPNYSLICLNKGVYLDFSSFVGNEQSSSSISFDVDDIEYYKNNPMVVEPEKLTNVSFRFNEADFSEFQQEEQSPFTVFTYEVSRKQNVDGLYELYAQEPSPVHIVYYENSSTNTNYVIGNEIGKEISESQSVIASWCDDGIGGFYIFEATSENYGDYNQKRFVSSPKYNAVHYQKEEKGTSFILKKVSLNYEIEQVPVSMCTDGTNIYYVESVLYIPDYKEKSPNLGLWGGWAHKDFKVKYFSISSPSDANELDFSEVFTNGKVTSVYYYNNELYVAGYKKESIGSITDDNGGKTDFFDSTYSVYKLSNPKDVSTAVCVSDVFKNSTEKARTTDLLDNYNSTNDRIKSYNAITDMAIMDGKLYVLENSYYYASVSSYIAKGSLRQISLENGVVLDTFDKSNSDSSGKDSFVVPNKIIAILPKKLELQIADSGRSNGRFYKVKFSDTSTDITEAETYSSYSFDNYSAGSEFFNSDAFNSNAYYTTPASTDTLVSE